MIMMMKDLIFMMKYMDEKLKRLKNGILIDGYVSCMMKEKIWVSIDSFDEVLTFFITVSK